MKISSNNLKLQILQRSNGYYFDLGVQSRESWNYTDSGGLSIKYIAADTQRLLLNIQ